MPGVFGAINTRIQGGLIGKNLKKLSRELPDGEVVSQEGWVESILIPETSVYIKGKYDLLVKNHDETYTLIDLKISQPGDDKIDKYKTQLTAYKYALENPKTENPIKITKLGLLIFYPESVTFDKDSALVDFPPKWLEVPIDEKGFFKFVKEIDKLLKSPLPPESKTCKWCQYRHVGEQFSHNQDIIQNDLPF
jgi:CRISPR/Cas system-associated exonuclease Cas4 (RecB family)